MIDAQVLFRKCKKELGLDKRLLTDLLRIVHDNPDKESLYNTNEESLVVSPYILKRSTRPDKLRKLLERVNIYNLYMVNISPTEIRVVGKTPKGKRVEIVSDKSKYTLPSVILLFLLKAAEIELEGIEFMELLGPVIKEYAAAGLKQVSKQKGIFDVLFETKDEELVYWSF